MINEHTLLALTIRTLLIFAAWAACAVFLFYACYSKSFRHRLFRERVSRYEAIPFVAVIVFGAFFWYHLGMHGGLFHCKFPRCESTAALWLVLYPAALLLQPIAAKLSGWSYTRMDYLRWAAFGIAFWLVSCAAGKLNWTYIHFWYLGGIV